MSNKYTEEQEAQAKKIALQIAEELAGGLQNIIVCTGCKDFLALTAEPEKKYIGGLAFRYPRRFTSNRSNEVRIFAMQDGTRKLEWGYVTKEKGYLLLETEEGVAPEKLEEVWWNHTACTVRPPWFVEACRIKVKLGRTVVTHGANEVFSQEEIAKCMKRHSYGDWGDCCDEDKKINDAALNPKNPCRVLSVYKFEDGRVLWLITEWDRSVTTALLPSEY